jgi:hypothetical protein
MVITTDTSPFGVLTRDRWIGVDDTSGGMRVVNLADGLDSSGATVWDSSDVLGTVGSGLIQFSATPVVSGNFLYGGSGSSGFTVFQIAEPANPTNTVWGPGPYQPRAKANTVNFPGGQLDVVGSLALLPDSNSVAMRAVDLSDLTTPVTTGLYALPLTPRAVLTYGHYAIVAADMGGGPFLRFLELATPRALTVRTTNVQSGHELVVRPGFAVTSGAFAFDLHAGTVPSPPSTTGPTYCTTHTAWFGDVEVGASGNSLVVRNIETMLDRDGNTPGVGGPDTSFTYLATSVRITGVAAWGNYLVAAEVRNPGNSSDGLWIDVFNATAIRDRQSGTSLAAPGDRVASYQFLQTSTNLTNYNLDVTMTDGRAAVSVSETGLNRDTTGTNVYFLDLRPAFDDDAATTLGADTVQGTISGIPFTNRTVISGQYAYLATEASTTIATVTQPGFIVASIPGVMDNNPATKSTLTLVKPFNPTTSSPANTLATALNATPAESVVVYGSAAYLAPGGYNLSAIYVMDVSTPLSPRPLGFYPWMNAGGNNQDCTPTNDTLSRPAGRGNVEIAGPRLYATPSGTFQVFDME